MLRLVKKQMGVESRLTVRDGERFWEWLPPQRLCELEPMA